MLPAFAVALQVKYAQGGIVSRLTTAFLPWLVLCGAGLVDGLIHDTSHSSEMNASFFQMPLYSAFIGTIIVGVLLLLRQKRGSG